MAKELKRNPKQRAGEVLGNPFTFATLLTASSLGIFAGTDVALDNTQAPDAIGTAQAEEVLAEHQATFSELQDMKTEIGLYEARMNLGGSSDELNTLKDQFATQAVNAYLDLYLDGATQGGAAISEQTFAELRTEFTETIAPPSELGFNDNIEVGMLDETLAQTDLSAATDQEKYKTVMSLDQQMADSYEENMNDGSKAAIGFGGSMLGALILLLICAPFSNSLATRWREQPEYIEKRPPSRKPGKYGQH